MKTLNITLLAIIFITCGSNYSAAQNQKVSFTQEDRDKLNRIDIGLARLEVKVEEQLKRVEEQFKSLEMIGEARHKSLQKQIDNMRDDMKSQFYVIISGIFILIGLIFWDRRTIMAPVIKENQAMKRVFLRLAENNIDVKEALKAEGIL